MNSTKVDEFNRAKSKKAKITQEMVQKLIQLSISKNPNIAKRIRGKLKYTGDFSKLEGAEIPQAQYDYLRNVLHIR
jgi:hypothetical protein